MHDSTFDAVVVSEVCLSDTALRLELLPLRLDLLKLALVDDSFKEVLDLSVFSLELIFMVAPLFYNLLDLSTTEEILLLVPE